MFADGGTVSDPATGGTIAGEEIKEWVEETTEGSPDVRFGVERRVADHDEGLPFAEWTMHGTHDGPFGPLPPTGQSVEVNDGDVTTFSDDGITAIDGLLDMADSEEQLGLTCPAVIGRLPTLAIGTIKTTVQSPNRSTRTSPRPSLRGLDETSTRKTIL